MDTPKKTWDFFDEFRGKKFTGEWPTLSEMMSITATRYPDRNAFTVFDPDRITLTYAELEATAKKLACWMNEKGINKGDHVALSGKNSPEWAIVLFAVSYAGAIAIPLDYGLHNNELESLINTAKPKLLFIDEEKHDHFVEFAKKSESLGHVYSLSKKHPETYIYNLKPEGVPELPKATENDLAAILFTSGTTGNPKGVMLTHKNFVSDCYIAQTRMNIFHTDIFYALLPLHHSYTLLAVLIETVSVGAEVIFGKTLAVSKLIHELQEGKVTMFLGVPLLFNKLISGILKGIKSKGPIVFGLIKAMMGISYMAKKVFKANIGKALFKPILQKAGLYNLRIAICGGGPLAPSIFRAYNEFGINFVQGYGLTETSPIVALNPVEHFKIESVGQSFFPYSEVKVINPDEKGVGELCFKGPMIMQGYYNMPEETAEVLSEDGWFRTGDLGWIDEEQYVYLCGRAKNMIVTEGGKNVYPEEIENAFQLYFNEIEQITVQGYTANETIKSEEPEALIYATDDLYKRENLTRGKSEDDKKIEEIIQNIVDNTNKTLLPYQRITKVTMLSTPLEMTTTKKVKRKTK
ncbi:MAG: long-chain fatty acid--CoA ligase [Treponema sp.]|nr:MAG: long-chain fatty acid--CoA ligase [Treponema sp.]